MANARRNALPPLSEEDEARVQAAIAQDPNNPETTDEEFARMRPAREALPHDVYAALVSIRPGAAKRPAPVQLTLHLDAAALDAWRASGPGWEARMGDVLAREAPTVKRSA